MGALQDAILLADEQLPWNVDGNHMNFFSIKATADKLDDGLHKLRAYFRSPSAHLQILFRNLGHIPAKT